MSRERFIDPGIWASEQVCSVDPLARLLFIGIITHSDDHGFIQASVHTMKVKLFPADTTISKDNIRDWMKQLLDVGLLKQVEITKGRYLWIPTFYSWQPMRYRAKSRILTDMVAAGKFSETLDKKGRTVACEMIADSEGYFDTLPEIPETSGNLPNSPEKSRSGVVWCGVEDGARANGAARAPSTQVDGKRGKGAAAASPQGASAAPPESGPEDLEDMRPASERVPKQFVEAFDRKTADWHGIDNDSKAEIRTKALGRMSAGDDQVAWVFGHVNSITASGEALPWGVLNVALRGFKPPGDTAYDSAKVEVRSLMDSLSGMDDLLKPAAAKKKRKRGKS